MRYSRLPRHPQTHNIAPGGAKRGAGGCVPWVSTGAVVTPDLGEFSVGSRFSVRRFLGSGAFGVVYEAYDLQRVSLVAIKTLKQVTPESLYRLKREFRSLADLRHPNLVQLHELHCVNDIWFITMELVDGVSFLRWVRPLVERKTADEPSTQPDQDRDQTTHTLDGGWPTVSQSHGSDRSVLDPVRLRAAMAQLCTGVAVLHRAGRLHRDLKPSNVLVTPEGRVVILDFGLITELVPSGTVTGQEFAGTPVYMAPEQMSGQPVGASDWYSVGVMLCVALTGKVPFHGSLLEMLGQKVRVDDVDLSELSAAEPQEFAALSRALMRSEANLRPRAEDVLALVGSPAQFPVPPSNGMEVIGREAELNRFGHSLDRVRAGGTVVFRLRGESGVGKSALAQAFVQSAINSRNALVLEGRCFERESVPFKALDSVVDALSHFLKRLPHSEVEALLPFDPLAAARLFPVLERVRSFAHAPRREADHRDSIQHRRAGLASLRELLGRLARRRILLIHIDDAQWGDADSANAIIELLRPAERPCLLLLLTYRPDADNHQFLATLDQQVTALPGVDLDDLLLTALDEQAAIQLATRLIQPVNGTIPVKIARESGGSPFLIAELARDLLSGTGEADASFATLVANRVMRLSGEARRVLEISAIAGQPLPIETARQAAELPRLDTSILYELQSLHLARTIELQGTPAIECYHDKIREAVVAALSAERVVASHGQLARAFEVTGGPAETMALHFRAAGDAQRAADYWLQAADHASHALAFDRAVRLYQVVLSLLETADVESRREVLIKLGDALVNVGLGYEAARSYMAADQMSSGEEQLELRRRAVHELLGTGHLEEGLALAGRLLAALGMRMPRTQIGTLLALARYRTELRLRGMAFRRRRPADLTRSDLVRLDTCYSIALGLGLVDTLRGAVFQTRLALLALRAGDPFRVARALAIEAGFRSVHGPSTHGAVTRLLDGARRLAAEVDQPYAHAICLFAEMIVACEWAEWRKAIARCDEATDAFQRCSGVRWERVTAQTFGLFALYSVGDWAEYGRRSQRLMVEARQRGDLYAQTSVSLMSYALYLVRDDPAGAEAEHREAAARWTNPTLDVQQFWHVYGICEIELYRGHALVAFRRILDVWPRLQRSLLLGVQVLHVFALYLKGRCAIAAAVAGHPGAIATARRAARGIERKRVGWATAFADIIRAGIAAVEGRDDQVVARLESARVGLVVADMQPWLAAISFCQSTPGVGSPREPRNDWFVVEGVRDPKRFAALMVPGVRMPTGST
jgi:serine/threonine protein kinase